MDVEEGKKVELDRHGLPAELRMDDYDDDDEAAGGGQKAAFIHADATESDGEEEEDEEEDVEEMLEGKMQEMEEAEGEDEDEDGEGEEEGEDKTGEEELAGVLPASAFMRGMEDDGDDDEDSEDMDDHMIRPTDAVALVANTEGERWGRKEGRRDGGTEGRRDGLVTPERFHLDQRDFLTPLHSYLPLSLPSLKTKSTPPWRFTCTRRTRVRSTSTMTSPCQPFPSAWPGGIVRLLRDERCGDGGDGGR